MIRLRTPLLAALSLLLPGGAPSSLRASILKGPYLQNIGTDRITLMWESDTSIPGRVDYGATPGYGQYADSVPSLSLCGGYIHEIPLEDLDPGSWYYYQVKDAGETAAAADFLTPAETATAFSFVAYGDNRSGHPDHATRHGAVVSAILAGDRPDLVLNLGDVVEVGDFCLETGYFGWGNEYFRPAQPLLEKVPSYVAIGNHEYNDSGNPQYFQDYFSHPANPSPDPDDRDLWYSFDYGNAHFTVINTNYYEVGGAYWPGSPQYQWLEADLRNSSATWKVAAFHHPPYASYPRDTETLRRYLVPLLERYGVQVVFSGHDHFYERSRKRGIHYIVTGGGGAPLYLPDDPGSNPYSIYADFLYHFCRTEIDGSSLSFFAADTGAVVFDAFQLDLLADEDGDGYSSGEEFASSWDPASPYSPRPGRVISGDYDGDGTSDIAVFRTDPGLWAIRGITRSYFGRQSDLPVSGDYNGDSTAGIGIFRPAAGLWAIRSETRFYFGSSGDLPVNGDYDGDGSDEAALFRPDGGLWLFRGETRIHFGRGGDQPVGGDFDGDGSGDIAVFRPETGLWAVRGVTRFYVGRTGDYPFTFDPDGEGTADAAVYRSASGLWAVRGLTRFYFGTWSDYPLAVAWVGDGVDDPAVFRPDSGLWAVRGLTRIHFGAAGDVLATR